ncbi:MAG: N-acetyltransferase family protein [bacterium]
MREPQAPVVRLEPMQERHWLEVCSIYLEGIATGDATFETAAPSWEEWDQGHLPFARIVAIAPDGNVQGWASLSLVSKRSAYAGVAEVSIYLAARARGKGVGSALLERLVQESELNGIWTLQASIFPENEASLELHSRCGFREVGARTRIAKLKGVWRSTILLERRSGISGQD